MAAEFREWLHLCFRWLHIIAGIMWIGNSMFFNWLDRHLSPKEGIDGELWMVHSGGFYQVEKKMVAPDKLPPMLYWFKWEAAFTWISGICLLILVYYMGGGAFLVDPSVSGISVGWATALGLGLLVASWVVYDLLMQSPVGKDGNTSVVVGFVMVAAVAYGLSHVLSGRAAFIHVGAMLGTWMAANVWMRILPAQRQLVAATKEGRRPDAAYAKAAKLRSLHNNYMTFPLIYIMLSNHFPNTYGSRMNWLVLLALMLIGAGIRHLMNVRDRSPNLLLGGILVAMAAAAVSSLGSSPGGAQAQVTEGVSLGGPAKAPRGVDTGSIHGVVRLSGSVPEAKQLAMPAGCAEQHGGPVLDSAVLSRDGLLQNAFVAISSGLDGWKEPAPREPVQVDQRGCIYEPRVLGAQAGQPVVFINSDPVLHNVRTVAEGNPTFNELMAQKDMRMEKTFAKPEVMVHAKCDIHPWMSAFIGVLPHPYFAVSNQKGEYFLRNVPAGDYVVEAWHEVYGKQTQKVTVGKGGTAEVDFSFGKP